MPAKVSTTVIDSLPIARSERIPNVSLMPVGRFPGRVEVDASASWSRTVRT